MKGYFALFAVLTAVALADNWAVVYGTKDGWGNYSIQSNPCRQYTLLRKAGFPADHIIFMAYSSIIKSHNNPYPGKIFTDAADNLDGDWAQYGCFENIDYTDKEINAKVFLALLAADKEKLKELTGREDVRVIESGPEDNVFMYFIDHGNDGIIAVGNDVVTDDQLINSLQALHDGKKYKKLVWYMEACHSGSMFANLPDDWNMYVMTSSDAHHNAYMSNCPPYDVVAGKSMDTCLSGLWDNYYMEEYTKNSEATLQDMFTKVHERVAAESNQNVSEFGDMDMHSEKLSDYTGIPEMKYTASPAQGLVDLYEVPRHLALWKAVRAESKSELSAALKELKVESTRMAREEVEGMRLARLVMDEKAANKASTLSSEVYDYKCYQALAEELITKCGHSLPFNPKVSNVLKAICLPGLRAPNVNFHDVCM